jgi:Fuc2NAc and GlcNAc transferase
VSVGVINVVWLFPLALCVTLLGLDGALGVVIAYVPLLLLAVKYKAGMRE